MKDYKITVIKNNPEYANINLLLANKNKDGLFSTSDDEIVELKIDSNGLLQCNFIKNSVTKSKDLSLRKIGIDFLKLSDPPVERVLKYLITPEMEIERIFNNIRFKYLQSIFLSEIEAPSTKISATFNKAFQSFAGIIIYQGNTPNRVDNDSFWREAGFTEEARGKISFEKEFKELDFIISYLRNLRLPNYNRVYAELIAIKPGFHEIIIHENYFEKNEAYRSNPENNDKDRNKVFKLLRGYGKLMDIYNETLRPTEINRMKYFSYAPCNITEGPFVFRRKLSVSYYDEIREIDKKEKLDKLKENFHIYDYYHNKPKTINDLKIILKETERFKTYLHD
jgi:hypothetical protein